MKPPPNFRVELTRSEFLDVASVLCNFPGIEAPVFGTGAFVDVANTLLCPAFAGPAIIALLETWGEVRGVEVRGEREGATMSVEEGESFVHVRINDLWYRIRATAIPTLFTLLLPLFPSPLLPGVSFSSTLSWRQAEPHWRRTAVRIGFEKFYPNEGISFGFKTSEMAAPMFAAVGAPTTIHLANATTTAKFMWLVENDPQAMPTKVPRS